MPSHIVTTRTVNLDGIGSIRLVEVGPGQWCWQTPGFNWKYNDRISPPMNNVAMQADGQFHYQMRVSQIEIALAYTMGFSFGYRNGVNHAKEDGTVETMRQALGKAAEVDPNLPPVKADDGITPKISPEKS